MDMDAAAEMFRIEDGSEASMVDRSGTVLLAGHGVAVGDGEERERGRQ